MINIPGQLAIRTINGRNGEFNVGKLSTSIGEFVIKDALLDQHIEGKYRGDFAITEIRPSYYTTGGRLVVEIRAKLDSMTLDDVDNLSDEEAERLSGNEVDPLDEVPAIQQPTAAPAAPPKSPQKPKPLSPAATGDDAPFGMDPPAPAEQAATLDTDADAELFGTVWPLGEIVKLDTTVDRKRLRQQCVQLGALGYELDFKQQVLTRKACPLHVGANAGVNQSLDLVAAFTLSRTCCKSVNTRGTCSRNSLPGPRQACAAAGAAGADEQLFAQVFLQLLDGARQGRLLDVQLLRCTGKVEFFGHSQETAKMSKLHVYSSPRCQDLLPRVVKI